jgi:L-fuculose-phosphate aldolase
MVEHLKTELSVLSQSMFQNDFFGLFHGSISAKTDNNRFIINKKEAIFHQMREKDLLELGHSKDYRWKESSIDTAIHSQIYAHVSDAKFISFSMPPYTTAYTFNHSLIVPKDYFGNQEFKSINIYDPKNLDDWYDRANSEIPQYFIHNDANIIIIKGYGVFTYSRDIHSMTRRLAILENSCRLLMLGAVTKNQNLEF